jgi:GTP-binding protein Era
MTSRVRDEKTSAPSDKMTVAAHDEKTVVTDDNMTTAATRCGLIAIVGRPNVGKSTLLNALIGTKISIVSRKAQTTRYRIQGVLTRGPEQFIFVDTPGFQTRYKGAMNRQMNQVVTQTLAEVDVVVHVVEAGKWSEGDAQVLPLLPSTQHTILAINKLDQLKDRGTLFPYVEQVTARHAYDAVVPISAQQHQQLAALLDELAQRLPEGEHLFDEETLTDRSMRFLAAEFIREKIFRFVGDELPYSCTVVIEQWEETEQGVRIDACIIVPHNRHRPILLGANGLHMKRIATEARQEIARLLNKSIYLNVYIKVRQGGAARGVS